MNSAVPAAPQASGTYAPGRAVPVLAILGGLRHGGGDPTWRRDETGLWLGQHTPDGPASVHLRVQAALEVGDEVVAQAWGPGAPWSIRQLPELLGDRDDPSGFTAHHPVLEQAHRAAPHYRVPRTGLVMASLVPVIIEQRVTGRQAFGAWRTLVRRFGSPAPGPAAARGVLVPPTIRQWRGVPSWAWLQAGVDAQRADTVMRALSVAARLEECVDLPLPLAHRRLRAVPGIGIWTANETAQRALGDADAVSVGDFHVAHNITYALEGRVGDDARMLQVLQPYAGHRFRVQRLLERAHATRPRRGPRLSIPTHLPG